MADEFRATCGANPAMDADLVGCGKPILNQRELYRCTDCGVPSSSNDQPGEQK